MIFTRFFRIALLALTLVIGETATAAVINYGKYYDDQNNIAPCPGAASCRLNLAQLPSNKLLLVNRVACYAIALKPIIVFRLDISATQGGASLGRSIPVSHDTPTFVAAYNQYIYSFNTEVRFLIGQGRYPYVTANLSDGTSAQFSLNCGIAGELVDPI